MAHASDTIHGCIRYTLRYCRQIHYGRFLPYVRLLRGLWMCGDHGRFGELFRVYYTISCWYYSDILQCQYSGWNARPSPITALTSTWVHRCITSLGNSIYNHLLQWLCILCEDSNYIFCLREVKIPTTRGCVGHCWICIFTKTKPYGFW